MGTRSREHSPCRAEEPASLTPAAGEAWVKSGDPVLNLADELYNTGEYNAAVTEYKRFLFFNSKTLLTVYAMMQTGKAFRDSGALDEAQRWFLKAARTARGAALENGDCTAGPDSLQVYALLEHALISMAKGAFTKAEFELYQLSSMDGLAPAFLKRIRFHQGLLFVYTARWREAEEAFSKALADRPEALAAVGAVLEEAAGRKLKDPAAAKVLSTVLPGLGQAYSERPLDGVNAFLINGGVFFFFGWNIAERNYPEAVLTFLYLVLRFYPGNIYQAGRKARDWNTAVQEKYKQKVFAILDRLVE